MKINKWKNDIHVRAIFCLESLEKYCLKTLFRQLFIQLFCSEEGKQNVAENLFLYFYIIFRSDPKFCKGFRMFLDYLFSFLLIEMISKYFSQGIALIREQ